MPSFTDQIGNIITLPNHPRRIISLVPSQTELLYEFGLDEEVIGITKFCVHPAKWFKSKQRVGGTKTVDIEKIKRLQPDLIVANKEENVQQQIEALQLIAPVWVSDVNTLQDALNMIDSLGQITGKVSNAASLVSTIQSLFQALTINQNKPINVAYLIWQKPYMAAGGDTFINNMLTYCGFNNVLEHQMRYPEVTLQQLNELDCHLLLLSSEPYPFTQKHINEMQNQLPNTHIMLVDGEMFSWYGSRLVQAAAYFSKLKNQVEA